MILMIDNYDSFTYNLVQYFRGLGAEMDVVRNDKIDVDGIRALKPQALVLSPGPGNPDSAGVTLAAIKAFADSARRRHLDICLAGETAVLPVLVGKDEDAWLLSNELKKRGVSVPPAMYPAVPKGKARLRFCVISEHKPEQIERALDILESTAREFGIELPRRNYD